MLTVRQAQKEKNMDRNKMERFPCGCCHYAETAGGRKRLVVVVSPHCRFDNDRVGKAEPHVRYEAAQDGDNVGESWS